MTVKIIDGGLCSFLFSLFYLIFLFFFIFYFLFLEQLGHRADHGTWENEVEGSETK